MIIGFVDENRAEFGVESVCAALQVAPSTYWPAKWRRPSARALRDARLMPVLLALWQANYSVYGARKLWIAARRAGHGIGRDQVARLMGRLGIRGVKRTKKVRTTRADPKAARPPDLVERDFTADAPNRLWVADLTHVANWSEVAYVCFITDAFSRRIVGWRVAGHMRTQTVVNALETARRARRRRQPQFTGLRYGERLDEIGAVPLIGSATHMTTRWPRRSTRCPRSSWYADPAEDRGAPSTTSSSPPWDRCTGGTPSASTATSATSPPTNSKRRTLTQTPTTTTQKAKTASLRETQGESCLRLPITSKRS